MLETDITPAILIVDDDADVLEAMTELLQDSGYRVEAASSGRAALDLLDGGFRPDAMVVDYGMPHMTGLDLLDACAQTPGLADIPTLMTSAHRTGEMPKTHRVSYLRKPFSLQDLLDRVDRLTGRK